MATHKIHTVHVLLYRASIIVMPKAFFSIASEEIIIDFSFHFIFEIESIILKLLKLKQYHHAYTNALYNMLSTKFRKELFGLVTPGI